jgi:single-strand DNA-binding protein
MDLNKAMLIGNIASDIEMRSIQSGQNVTSFRVATNRRWKDKTSGEMKEDAQFHSIVAWGKLGEICNQYMQKGKKIYVEGRIQTRTWDDPQSGQKKYFTEIVAENVIMLDPKGQGGSSVNNQSTQSNPTTPSNPSGNQQNNVNIPSPEQIPTINIDEENQEEIKVKDIPF